MPIFPVCSVWSQVAAAQLLAWSMNMAGSWATHAMEMCPARSILPATPHCSRLCCQSWLLPCLFIMFLSKDFAGDAREKRK